MNIKNHLYVISLLCLTVLITGCSVSSISLEVVRPADIDVPNHIQKVLVLNRTSPGKKYQFDNILDGILSGEGVGDDKKGSEVCVSALQKTLGMNSVSELRFDLLTTDDVIDQYNIKGTGTSELPKPIKWKKIKKIFKNHDLDGLIVLETFDSRSSIINGGFVDKIQFLNKKKNKEKLIKAILNIEVQAGWRIYDIKNQTIVDEKIFIDQKTFSSKGVTFEIARDKLPTRRQAIIETGLFAGEQYGYRISPNRQNVKRSFYKKVKRSFKFENKSFEKAAKLIKNNKFEQSASIWNNFVTHQNNQIAGRACFNMALVCELKNKFNLAEDWLKKAISYNNPKAVDYFSVLQDRKSEIKRVKQQLKK